MSATNKALCTRYYDNGNGAWTLSMLAAACAKGKITETEYQEITGEAYAGAPYIPSDRAAVLEAQLSQSDSAVIELYEMILALQEGGI